MLTHAVAQPAEPELPAGERVGEYIVGAKLAEGGMGTIYSAQQPLIGKKVAIKVLRSALCQDVGAVERFVQEARAVNQIGHPNIVDIFSFGILPDGRSYLVMELLQGQSMARRIARGVMPLADVADMLEQICRGLREAHKKGIVHRDLKPDNIFLVSVPGDRPLVKLLDFGIAKLGGPDGESKRTQAGMVMGTPEYMAPEQVRGQHIDDRTDIYALGAVVFEMMTGQPPFQGGSVVETMAMHINHPVPSPAVARADIPPELDRIVMQMLAKQPDERPALPVIRAAMTKLRPFLAVTARTRLPPEPARPTPEPVAQAARPPEFGPPHVPAAIFETTDPVERGRLPKQVMWGVFAGVGLAAIVAIVLAGRGKPPPAIAATPPGPQVVPLPVVQTLTTPATIEVTSNVAKSRFELDGRVIAESAPEARITADPGSHTLVVSAAGRRPFRKTLELTDGATLQVAVKLSRGAASAAAAEPAPPPPPHQPSKSPPKPATASKPSQKPGWVDPFAQ
jgi:serine/threonine-protein kinase